MGTLYCDTGGNAANSGSTDTASPTVSGSAATVAGSVVTLDGSPDLSATVTSGATQSTIHISDATNANTKIFWITAFDDGADTVTVSVAPTGVTSSAWRIGGQHVYTKASIEGALRGGDTVIVNNSPAAHSGSDWFEFRADGTGAAGPIKVVGKTGVRPVINVTDTNQCIQGGGSGNDMNWVENLELDQDGASGAVIDNPGHGSTIYNVKISDGGAAGINQSGGLRNTVIGCEITGVTLDGIISSTAMNIIGCNLHDNGQNGIQFTGGSFAYVLRTIVDSNTARGIFCNGAITSPGVPTVIMDTTVYGNGNTGLEVVDTDWPVVLLSSIFSENGNAAGEYNVEYTAGSIEVAGGLHANNLFFHSGGGGGANLSGLTANSTESTADPVFTGAASGNFAISSSSPAKATGYPTQFLGGNANYLDMGAVQRQESGGETCVASAT